MAEDRRNVRKSKEAIKRAYRTLIAQKNINEITINEIITLADVSRGTFYAHFKDIYDVKHHVEEDLLNYCTGMIGKEDMSEAMAHPYEAIYRAVTYIMKVEKDIKNVSENGKNSGFLAEFKEALINSLIECKLSKSTYAEAVIQSTCIASCIVDSCMMKILNPSVHLTNEILAQIITNFVDGGVKNCIKMSDG